MSTYAIQYSDEAGSKVVHAFKNYNDAVEKFLAMENTIAGVEYAGFPSEEDSIFVDYGDERILTDTGYDEERGNWTVQFIIRN